MCPRRFRSRPVDERRPYTGAEEDIVGRLLGGVADRGDIAEVDRALLIDAHDDGADIGGIAQEGAGFEENFGVGRG